MWRTVHVNHTKLAKLTAPDLPLPTPAPEPPRPALGYLPRSLQRPCSRPPPPPQKAAPTGGTSPPPTASVPTPPAPLPPVSERPNLGVASANRNSAPPPRLPMHSGSEIQPPTSAPADQNSESTFRQWRSARLNPGLNQACSIKGPPRTRAPQSQQITTMARTYPLSLGFNQCLGAKEEPFASSSVYIEDLHNGKLEYLSTLEQLVDALPETDGPGIQLRSPRPRLSYWPPSSLSLHASCPLVVTAVGWRILSSIALSLLLPRTPGMACGLARG